MNTLSTPAMPLPIGYDNFQKIIENKLEFVDKSLLIEEIINDISVEAAVITRPRRFGKTLNLSMLHYFFSKEVNGKTTKDLFDHLKISKNKDLCAKYQGQYPVIFVTFKDVKGSDFNKAYSMIGKLMRDLYLEHKELLVSDKLDETEKQAFKRMIEGAF